DLFFGRADEDAAIAAGDDVAGAFGEDVREGWSGPAARSGRVACVEEDHLAADGEDAEGDAKFCAELAGPSAGGEAEMFGGKGAGRGDDGDEAAIRDFKVNGLCAGGDCHAGLLTSDE